MKRKRFKLCTIGMAISALTATALGLPMLAQQKTPPKAPGNTKGKDQAEAKPATAKVSTAGMAGPGKWVPADIAFRGYGCTVLVPGDYSLAEFLAPNGKLFSFKGPQHPDKKMAVFNVTIVPSPKGEDIPGEKALMETMLNPQRTGLTNYKEQKEPIFTNGGHSFKGVSFSGKAKDGEDRRGFVYLTQDKETFFILFAQDEEPFADHALALLLQTAKGCQINKPEPESKAQGQTPSKKP